jgi:hypothetical protein
MTDAPLVFALGLLVGLVGGWQLHGACRELMATARWTIRVLRRLDAWHRARDACRLAALEIHGNQMRARLDQVASQCGSEELPR